MKQLGSISSFIAILFTLATCTTLPSEGPSTEDIVKSVSGGSYVMVEVDEKISGILATQRPSGLNARFRRTPTAAPSDIVGVGDVLAIRVLEAGREGLFSQMPNGGTSANFPAVIVGTSGEISLPYVGVINVVGLKPAQIEEGIASALDGHAIEPQASVSVVKSANNNITLSGTLMRPGQYPLSLRGDKLAQAISAAGGSKLPDFETRVTVIRNGIKGYTRLDRVLLDPSQNIKLQRDDLIVLSHEPEKYTITGAVLKSGMFKFNAKEISALEAVSRAGGLLDRQADPSGVFVFRYESKALLKRLGYEDAASKSTGSMGFPTIYRINLEDISSRFSAQAFPLKHADAVFVSNSDSIQITKMLGLFRASLDTLNAGATLGTK